jgi:superfamily I DNA and RNA helicase
MNDFNMRSKRKIYKWYEGYVHDTPELNTTHHMMAHGGHTKVPVMTEAVSGNSYIQAYAEVADIYAFGNNTSQCYNMAHPLQGG